MEFYIAGNCFRFFYQKGDRLQFEWPKERFMWNFRNILMSWGLWSASAKKTDHWLGKLVAMVNWVVLTTSKV